MDPSQIPKEWWDLKTLCLQVTVYIDLSNVDKFMAAMRPIFELVANEPECLYFEIYQDPVQPGMITWVENWSKGVEWLMKEQLTKDYYKPYFEATIPLYVKEREFKVLRRLEGFVAAKEANFRGAFAGSIREESQ